MSDKPYNQKGVHERVALGEKPPQSQRQSGVMLTRPGHFSALSHTAASAQRESPLKGGRAVRATVKPSHQTGRKD